VTEGAVNAELEAVVLLSVSGPQGKTQEIEAVIDTGYNGYVTLPPAMVERLRLPLVSTTSRR